jgi:hypothetical protein
MTEQAQPEQSDSRKARDGRALAVAEMLRSGWTAQAVNAGLKVIDAGGGVVLAMEAMRTAQGQRAGAHESIRANR